MNEAVRILPNLHRTPTHTCTQTKGVVSQPDIGEIDQLFGLRPVIERTYLIPRYFRVKDLF